MRNRIAIGLLVCAVSIVLLGATLDREASVARDPALDAEIMAIMDQFHIPGAAVSSFYPDPFNPGEVVLHHMGTYGYAQLEENIPVEEWTTFCAGSVSKVVSATSFFQAWETHEFGLHDDVNEIVDFLVVHPTCPDSVVTYQKLLTHTSSLPGNNGTVGAPVGMPICDGLAEFFNPDGQFYDPDQWHPSCPGEVYLYGRAGPTLLACVAAEMAGTSFPECSQASLFGPLGMVDTAWFGDAVDQEFVAYSYSWAGGDFYRDSLGGADAFCYPARSLRTSIADLTRFTMAYMNGGVLDGVRVLNEETIDAAFTIQFDTPDGEIGLMWRYYCAPSGYCYWLHPGLTDHYVSYVLVAEDRDYGLVVLTNGGDINYEPAAELIVAATAANVREVVTAVGSTIPYHVAIGPNFPNPFNPQTSIRFAMPGAGHARLTIHDLRGRLVATLVDERVAAGDHSVSWTGRYADGREAPSGVYFSRLEAGDQVTHGKMTLVR